MEQHVKKMAVGSTVDVDDMSMVAAEELCFYVLASKHFNMLNEFNVGSLEWCFPHFSAYISLSLC